MTIDLHPGVSVDLDTLTLRVFPVVFTGRHGGAPLVLDLGPVLDLAFGWYDLAELPADEACDDRLAWEEASGKG